MGGEVDFGSCSLDKACNIIREFEGFKKKAYRCPAGKWTLGFGRTKGIKENDTCDKEQAEKWLYEDVTSAAKYVKQYVKVPLTENQFNALVSFVFNVGSGNFKDSTLLLLLNRGWYEQVPAQLARWNRSNGEILGGLSRRRAAEAALFNRREENEHPCFS